MIQKWIKRLLAFNAVIAVALLPLILFGFQNCAPKNFTVYQTDANSLQNCTTNCPTTTPTPTPPGGTPTPPPNGSGPLALQDQLISTLFNTPISFFAAFTGDRTGYIYSFDIASNLSTIVIPNVGQVDVTDQPTWSLTFTPLFGYRGSTQIWVFARNPNGDVKQAQLTLQVGNAVNLLAPALAVRGTGCITCHAEVHSNMITDFGYGGDGNMRNYYFGGMAPGGYSWQDSMVYGDQWAFQIEPDTSINPGSWATINLVKNSNNTGQTVFVPAALLPTGPANATSATTLRGYVQHRLSHSTNMDTPSATAVEKGTVFIGAPTIARMKAVFNWTVADEAQKYKYIPDGSGVALSGINVSPTGPSGTNYFTNTGTVFCEGDLMLEGTVYLNNLNLQTKTGCRIYATGSVFIYGPITYLTGMTGDYSKRNLQISSTKAVMMGLGALWKNSAHCEAGTYANSSLMPAYYSYYQAVAHPTNDNPDPTVGWGAQMKADYSEMIADSAKFRLASWKTVTSTFYMNNAFFFRNDTRSGGDVVKDVYSEMMSTIGQQYDAACRPETRNVAYERLLLNAPLVEGRYTGGFKGSIIAEIALMGLGMDNAGNSRFRFEFDPVFQQADVLPLLTDQDFLNVQ